LLYPPFEDESDRKLKFEQRAWFGGSCGSAFILMASLALFGALVGAPIRTGSATFSFFWYFLLVYPLLRQAPVPERVGAFAIYRVSGGHHTVGCKIA